MKLKFVAAAVVAALSVGGSANATVTALGPVSVGVPMPFNGLVPPSLGFWDFFSFSLPANSASGYSVTNFALLQPLYNTSLNTLALYSNPDNIVGNADDWLLASGSAPGGSSVNLTYGASGAGNYFLAVGGIANGTQGGIYTGAISVTAVPEPETLAMMLAGLGALGFLARRRQNA